MWILSNTYRIGTLTSIGVPENVTFRKQIIKNDEVVLHQNDADKFSFTNVFDRLFKKRLKYKNKGNILWMI